MSDNKGRLEVVVGAGGWVRVRDRERGVRAFVRFDLASDKRLYPGAMLTQAHEPDRRTVRALRGSDLRAFPLAAIEASANGELRERILAKIDRKIEVEFRKADDGKVRPDPVGKVRRDRIASNVTVKVGTAHEVETAQSLKVPETRPYPDEFYAQVAEAYRSFVGSSRRPVAEIAERSDVTIPQVRRWVAEARRRRHLAPARQGKAG